MFIDTLFDALQHSRIAALLDGSRYIAITVQVFHILGFTLLLALVLAIALRVNGVALRDASVSSLVASLHRVYWISLGVTLLAGFLLFLPRAIAYGSNPAMAWKFAILVAAALLQWGLLRRLRLLDTQHEAGQLLRSATTAVLVIWFAAGAAGRAIGFV